MGIRQSIKNKAVEIAEASINKRVDLYPAGVETDQQIDERLKSEKSSERIQQGLVTDSFLEFLAGLHHDKKQWWADRLIHEAGKITGGNYGD